MASPSWPATWIRAGLSGTGMPADRKTSVISGSFIDLTERSRTFMSRSRFATLVHAGQVLSNSRKFPFTVPSFAGDRADSGLEC
jgi:hypothetical protein